MTQRVEVAQVHPQIYERKGGKERYGGKVDAALRSAQVDPRAEFTDIVEIEIQAQLDLDGSQIVRRLERLSAAGKTQGDRLRALGQTALKYRSTLILGPLSSDVHGVITRIKVYRDSCIEVRETGRWYILRNG